MKKLILLLIFMFTSLITKAQEINQKNKIDTSVNIEGTYQFQMIGIRTYPNIPGNLKEIILEKRDATKIVYVQLGTAVSLKIMPLSEIKKPDYKPLPMITYVTQLK